MATFQEYKEAKVKELEQKFETGQFSGEDIALYVDLQIAEHLQDLQEKLLKDAANPNP